MGAPLLQFETCVHHSRSRVRCGVTRTVPDHHFADLITSCSSRKNNLATGMAKCKKCDFPAKEARVFTLIKRVWAAARHIRVLARTTIYFSFAVGATNCPTFMSMIMLPDEDGVKMSLRRVNLEAQSCEQGSKSRRRTPRIVRSRRRRVGGGL